MVVVITDTKMGIVMLTIEELFIRNPEVIKPREVPIKTGKT